jgi:ribosome-associated toxin RatA of RatAB toxin-antitoxin module
MWKTEHSEVTTASPEAVWRAVADVAHWPAWNPGYSAASLDGPASTGTAGTVTLPNGMRRDFTVIDSQPAAAFVIGASGPGVRQRFSHRIEPLGDGTTRVTMAATMEGLLSPLFARLFGHVIAGYTPTAVRQLVAQAEAVGL